jgi:hypothetical protein
MNDIHLYPGLSGGWVYEVWFAQRAVVVGWCQTREAAAYQASRV